MSWIGDIMKKLALRSFLKKARKFKYPHAGTSLKKAKRIGAIINVTESNPKDLIALTEFITSLEKNGKNTVMIELNFQRKADPMFSEKTNAVFIGRKNVNWLGLPSRELVKEINGKNLDVLLDFDMTETQTARFISGFSNARTRVGLYETELERFYELMIEKPKSVQIKPIIEAYEHYLNLLEQ